MRNSLSTGAACNQAVANATRVQSTSCSINNNNNRSQLWEVQRARRGNRHTCASGGGGSSSNGGSGTSQQPKHALAPPTFMSRRKQMAVGPTSRHTTRPMDANTAEAGGGQCGSGEVALSRRRTCPFLAQHVPTVTSQRTQTVWLEQQQYAPSSYPCPAAPRGPNNSITETTPTSYQTLLTRVRQLLGVHRKLLEELHGVQLVGLRVV